MNNVRSGIQKVINIKSNYYSKIHSMQYVKQKYILAPVYS